METKLTEEQKQKLCELIEKSLNRVRLQNYKTDDDDNLPLVDMLSNGDTILEGQEEIANIIEQIFFDMDAWDISLKPVEIPEITDERFKMPTDKQLVEIALLFNDGKLQKSKLRDMIAMCEFVLDRLYENNDVTKPSSKE